MTRPSVEGPVYLDASALFKIYFPEPSSRDVDTFLTGREDLLVSDLVITESVSVLGRLRREGTITAKISSEVYGAILQDVEARHFERISLSPSTHRLAERLLLVAESIALRTLDALHLALAIQGSANALLTFDRRLAKAASVSGIAPVVL